MLIEDSGNKPDAQDALNVTERYSIERFEQMIQEIDALKEQNREIQALKEENREMLALKT